MSTLDSARSRRSDSPALFATLDLAIAQAEVVVDSDKLYALTVWSLNQGRRFPWYSMREQAILDSEGGKDAVVLTVAGAALCKMQAGLKVEDACFEAGKDWRSALRQQWGDVPPSQRAYWQQPVMWADLPVVPEQGVEEWVAEHAVELAGPTPEFNPENITDPRLAQLWAQLTDKQREAVLLKADGLTARQSAEHLGVHVRAVEQRLAAVRTKAKGAAS